MHSFNMTEMLKTILFSFFSKYVRSDYWKLLVRNKRHMRRSPLSLPFPHLQWKRVVDSLATIARYYAFVRGKSQQDKCAVKKFFHQDCSIFARHIHSNCFKHFTYYFKFLCDFFKKFVISECKTSETSLSISMHRM